jgi:hypothetical protein
MLRVTIEIVPFGEEDSRRVIHTILIARRDPYANPCDYDVRSGDQVLRVDGHRYEDGALPLVKRALEVVCSSARQE